jgi:hypothetical protein
VEDNESMDLEGLKEDTTSASRCVCCRLLAVIA